jgi:hypothetical protein
MQKWIMELELADEKAVRRIRKEMRARCARSYFGLTLAERERLLGVFVGLILTLNV